MVTCLSVCEGSAAECACNAASFERSPSIAASTTASPSTPRWASSASMPASSCCFSIIARSIPTEGRHDTTDDFRISARDAVRALECRDTEKGAAATGLPTPASSRVVALRPSATRSTLLSNADMRRERALAVLRETFGYEAFRGAQADIVDHVVAGGDALVLMPTGGGKSLCYQIPSMLRSGTGVVVSPLIALMQDQVAALKLAGVRAEFLNSSQQASTSRRVERALLDGELDLLYVAPERLTTQRCLELLGRIPLALFAIDEAHCVSQWGHDFRPEYLELSLLHQRFPDVPRVALTATADPQTRAEIIERLALR